MSDLTKIEELNGRFGISGIAQVAAGKNGLPKLAIRMPAASVEIYLHGAQVTSWQPAGNEQALFLSEHSHWQDGRAIRGGIPICFPWFRGKADDPKAPAHGFVRTKEWQLDGVAQASDGSVIAELSTASDEGTRQWWPHEFELTLRATIGATLGLALTVRNTGSETFRFEEALHTYFRISDARHVLVRGLDKAAYLDNTDGNREKVQDGDVPFNAATDNAYLDTAAALDLIDPGMRRMLRTEKQNSTTTIVWNPWQQGAAALSDLGEEEWRSMACVEAGNILASAVSLKPGQQHTMRATLSVLADALGVHGHPFRAATCGVGNRFHPM
jgi:glucose-6-phosphate 1-epimerase